MAKGHIHYTTLPEGFHLAEILSDGIPILDTQHDGTFALLFQSPQVIWRVGDIDSCAALGSHLLNLGEDLVGFGCRIFQRCLIPLLLFQIGNHDSGIEMSLCHLVEIYQYLRVARSEIDVLGEEHRSVTMTVEGEYLVVQLLGFLEFSTLLHEPLKDGQHFFAVAQDVGLRMPLHTHDGLERCALNGFDDPIRTHRRHLQTRGSFLACLMMEGIDSQFCSKEFFENGIFGEAHLMGRITAVLVLAVFDADALHLGVDVLVVGSPQCGIDDLNALADA